MMDGVPVKISERCRPPGKVHLPVSLRTLPPSESPAEPISFELENSALHWVQERRRNLLSERDGRRARLELKDEAKRRRQAEQAEQLRREEEQQQARRAEEAAQRLAEEEEQLRREEERRLEEFRCRRQQTGTPEPSETESTATTTAAPASTPTPTPIPAASPISIAATVACSSSSSSSAAVAVTSSLCAPVSAVSHDSVSTPSSRSLAAVPSAARPSQDAPPSHTVAELPSEASAPHPAGGPAADVSQSASPAAAAGWSANGVSSNPFNPFSGPSAAVMKPQVWQQQQQHAEGTTATRSGGFNYHDFESQASDPFDSVELKTINDMEELASVFRPPPAVCTAAAAPVSVASSRPQPAYSYSQQQQGGHHQHQQQHQQQYYSSAAVSTAGPSQTCGGRGPGYSLPGGYTPYPTPGYRQPAYTSIPNKPQSADPPAYRYPGGGYVYTSAGGRTSLLSDSSASRTTVAPGGPAAAPPQPDARQLQEFYTRYYATPGRASPGLRSSRSEPDLSEPILAGGGGGGGTDPDADGGAARRTKSHTPPPAASGATLPADQVWVPRPEPAAKPADPLHGLDPAVRARLQELGQMGFPLDRLRRLHSQFDGDEKQVIEFCLSAQRLEEAGHQPLAAERGLLECDGDLGRAADFLSSLAQLTGLGFPEPRAADALRRSDMHRDRALDLLIQG